MVRYPTLLALMLCSGLPASAHPGSHTGMDGAEFASHVGQSPFHLAFLAAAGIAAVAFAIALIRGNATRKRITSRHS